MTMSDYSSRRNRWRRSQMMSSPITIASATARPTIAARCHDWLNCCAKWSPNALPTAIDKTKINSSNGERRAAPSDRLEK